MRKIINEIYYNPFEEIKISTYDQMLYDVWYNVHSNITTPINLKILYLQIQISNSLK